MNIELKGDNFELSFNYKTSIIERVRQIPGRRFDGARKVWIVPTRSRVDLERMIYQIQQFENINWVSGTTKKEEDIAYDVPELPDLTIPHSLKIQPYPYQLKGIARGLELKRFMNCDEPGLGKTLQSIATINLANAFPCLVICPSSLKINWQREWEKFTDKKAMVLTDKVRDTWTFFYQTGMHQVFIVNYESLKKYFVQRIKKAEGWTLRDVEFRNSINLFKSVIIDESHRCKSASTQQAKFCKGICTGKEWVIELTGTPVVNRPKDLIPQLAILNRMDDFGGYKPFVNRYCSGQREASNLKELNFNLWKYCMFRREKSLVLTDLPDIYQELQEAAGDGFQVPVRFYMDSYPLSALYRLDAALDRALGRTVWLRSGGYLVIEPTEAMTVIDVNTGKYTGKKNKRDTILKINLEAAAEISHQMRLRNLSGIILVDFIDMEEKEDQELLMKTLAVQCARDPVKTTVVDMTRLNLVEITRKKIRKPLHEQVRLFGR